VTRRLPAHRLTRISAGVLDQLLSSGSNFLGLIAAARMLSTDRFGAYAVAIATYTVALGLCRAFCAEALLVRIGDDPDDQRDRAARAATDAFGLGVAVAPLILVVASLVEGPTAGALLALALTLPLLLLQDTLRYGAFARSSPRLAVLSDGTWVVLQVVVYAVIHVVGSPSALVMVLAWAGTGAVAGLVQLRIGDVRPRFGRPFSWLRENIDLGGRYATDFACGTGVGQIASYALVGVAGVGALGALRGAQTAFGPVNVLTAGSYIALVPEAKRIAQRSTRRLTQMCVVVAIVMSLASAAMFLVLWMLDDDQGRILLGDSWQDARQVLLPVALASMAGSVFAGASTGIRSLEAARELLRTRLFTTPVALTVPAFCAWRWGLDGAAWGIAGSVWWNNIWWWRSYGQAVRRFRRERAEAT
jgi:O-antigen/teichoic acid export membrane protein